MDALSVEPWFCGNLTLLSGCSKLGSSSYFSEFRNRQNFLQSNAFVHLLWSTGSHAEGLC